MDFSKKWPYPENERTRLDRNSKGSAGSVTVTGGHVVFIHVEEGQTRSLANLLLRMRYRKYALDLYKAAQTNKNT